MNETTYVRQNLHIFLYIIINIFLDYMVRGVGSAVCLYRMVSANL